MTGTAPSESSPKPVSRESHQELARERAEHHWQGIRSGFTKVGTGDFSASTLLGEMKGLVDQMPQLSKKDQDQVKQGFGRQRKNPQMRDIIDHELRDAFLEEIGENGEKIGGESQRKLYEALAKELGYLGNIVGMGVDVEVSKALGAESRGRRALLVAAGATLIPPATLGALYGAYEAARFFRGLDEAGRQKVAQPQVSSKPADRRPSLVAGANTDQPTATTARTTEAPQASVVPTGTATPATKPPESRGTSAAPLTAEDQPGNGAGRPPEKTPGPTATPEPRERLAAPQSEYIGFRVNSVEAIHNLPPTIKIIRIGGDTNRMNEDGSFIYDPAYDYEGMLAAADEKGLEVVFTYKASWFPRVPAITSDEDLERASTIIGNQFKVILKHPSVKYVEVGNEIDQGHASNVTFWEGSMEDYGLLFKMAIDNLEEINPAREKPAELILTSFADYRSEYGNTDKNISEFLAGLTLNGIDPSQYLIAAHAYNTETLQEVLDNLQQKTGTRGIIITEFNVSSDNTRKPAEEELAEMVQLIEERKVIGLAHEFENGNPSNPFAITRTDPRFKVIMNAVEREIDQAKAAGRTTTEVYEKRGTSEKAETQTPPKEGEILQPPELTLEEFREWEEKHKNIFDSVITEALFTKELGPMTQQRRQEVLETIAAAHAKAIVEHYGDTDAIIGLDPGHGVGSDGIGDVGSGTVVREGDKMVKKGEYQLTWEIVQMIAPKIMELSKNRYNVVILRPEHPQIRDMNDDGKIENWDNIRQRKILLAKEVARLRDDSDRERAVLYCSVHLNGSEDPSLTGTEVIYPHEVGVPDPERRESSKAIAERLQTEIVHSLREIGYQTHNRNIRADTGQKSYVALLA